MRGGRETGLPKNNALYQRFPTWDTRIKKYQGVRQLFISLKMSIKKHKIASKILLRGTWVFFFLFRGTRVKKRLGTAALDRFTSNSLLMEICQNLILQSNGSSIDKLWT